MTEATQQASLDVSKIRDDFPILSRKVYGKSLVYLDNAATSQKPRQVISALTEYYEGYNANVHRGVHALSMEATDRYEEAREKVARFIGARQSEEVIWTRNTTEAINLVTGSWARSNLQPGDEVVVTEMEHHSNMVPWQMVTQERGATLRYLRLGDDGKLDLDDIDTIINDRTKMVSIVHASNSLGTINPVKEITARARAVGAAVMIDGAQSVPHMSVDVQDLDCDFLAFSGHKMLGPTGIGVLYAKREVLETMEPFLTGGEMVLSVTLDGADWNDLPMRFEAGTPNIADAIALGAAVDYLDSTGMDNIRRHEVQLTGYALSCLREIEELVIFGAEAAEDRGGVVSFHTPDVHPHDLGTYLDQQGIAVRTGHHCTMPVMRKLGVPATTRASFYLYNTEEEVDQLVDSLKSALRYFGHG
jgi:cysteine desulfurase/selenocysteine lyase